MSEWWASIGQPFADAVVSLNATQLKAAVANTPSSYYEYIRAIFERSPEHVIVETVLICFVLYITLIKRDQPRAKGLQLSEKEIQELCDEWQPEPLIAPSNYTVHDSRPLGIVEKRPDTHLKLQGRSQPLLNLATFDFLGFGSRQELQDAAKQALTKYGCGSCGPRGFYGTIDVHETLEKDLSELMGTPDTITFSDTEATASTVLPAFAKRGDLVVCDEGCNDSILVGVNLARCTAFFYKHNDLDDLERVLKEVRDGDKRAGRDSDCQRRYVVTEAIFRNYGDMLNLPKVVELCEKYYFRLFLDEGMSIGVLGKTGRGITEHYDMDVSSVSIICGSLAASTASVGGFSTGKKEVVEYQRINSAGYVFSASAPPFTSACSSEALRLMKKEPQLFTKLRENACIAHDTLSSNLSDDFTMPNDRVSPIIHVRISKNTLRKVAGEDEIQQRLMARKVCDLVMDMCMDKGVAVCSPRYKTDQKHEPFASVRLSVTAIHDPKQLEEASKTVAETLKTALKEISN